MDITEGNWYFKRKIVKGGDASNVTLERGVVFYDSDFWRWTIGTLNGDLSNSKFGIPGTPANISVGGITPRRTLLLVQFFTRSPTALPEGSDVLLQTGLAAAGAALAGQSLAAVGASAVQGAVFGLLSHFGPFEFTARLPAKAWLLHGTLPIRYKAGSDFDASSSAVSIQQIELAIEMIEEVSLLA
jgi:phage tail-like protein